MDEIAARGHEVVVFRPDEGAGATKEGRRGSVRIVSVRTGSVTKVKLAKKAINTLLLESRYRCALRREMAESKPDLILYSTPPITFLGAVRFAKRRTGCSTYLLLKDIFPANACDIGLMKEGGLAWRLFRSKEERLYSISDRIGCMSKANVEYLLRKNPNISPLKIEICPNSIKPMALESIPQPEATILAKHGIPQRGALRLVYGGNLGRPQCVPFIIELLEAVRDDASLSFTIIGDGTEYPALERYIEGRHGTNAVLIKRLPKSEYLALLACMDAGLVFLDNRFTIPNFPSRILEYLDFSLPIIAATDTATDLRELLEGESCGLWSRCGDIEATLRNIRAMRDDPEGRKMMGRRGRNILLARFTATESAGIILSAQIKVEP
jgi:Glycosyltransferase